MKRKEVLLGAFVVLIIGIFLFSLNQKLERIERQLSTIEHRLGNPNRRASRYYDRKDIASKLDYIEARLDDIEGYLRR